MSKNKCGAVSQTPSQKYQKILENAKEYNQHMNSQMQQKGKEDYEQRTLNDLLIFCRVFLDRSE